MVHELLTERVPDDINYAFYRLLVERGRAYCTARNPQCAESAICRGYCSYYRDVNYPTLLRSESADSLAC